jgi:hypothetical protein
MLGRERCTCKARSRTSRAGRLGGEVRSSLVAHCTYRVSQLLVLAKFITELDYSSHEYKPKTGTFHEEGEHLSLEFCQDKENGPTLQSSSILNIKLFLGPEKV